MYHFVFLLFSFTCTCIIVESFCSIYRVTVGVNGNYIMTYFVCFLYGMFWEDGYLLVPVSPLVLVHLIRLVHVINLPLFCRTMSLVRSHMSSGQNFLMVILRFLETFVGSMSSGLSKLAANTRKHWRTILFIYFLVMENY